MDMTYHRFGGTGLTLSRVGLGAGGPSRLGRKRGATDDDVERLISAALELGINHIDTARGYGTEPSIGRALQRLDAGHVMVATKVHWHASGDGQADPYARDPQDLALLVDEALRNLRRDHIEIFQFHAVTVDELPDVIDRLLPVAQDLQQAGKIGHIGITEEPSSDHEQQMAPAAIASGRFATIMLQYSILDQRADAAGHLAAAREADMGVFCMSAARTAFTGAEALATTLAALGRDELAAFRDRFGDADPARIAFQFAAAREQLDVVLVGTGRPEHLKASTDAVLSEGLPADDVDWLRERYGDSTGDLLWPQ